MEALQRTLFRLFAFARNAPASVVVGLLGGLAALLLVITEFSTIVSVTISSGDSCEVAAEPEVRDLCHASGFEQHAGVFILLAAAVGLMTYGAARRASRPAAAALMALGGVVLLIWLIVDVPQTDETGLIGINYDGASASPAFGFYLEIVAAVLCAAAGVVGLVAARRGGIDAPPPADPPPTEPRRRSRRTAAG